MSELTLLSLADNIVQFEQVSGDIMHTTDITALDVFIICSQLVYLQPLQRA
jgi:hypothetical protein